MYYAYQRVLPRERLNNSDEYGGVEQLATEQAKWYDK